MIQNNHSLKIWLSETYLYEIVSVSHADFFYRVIDCLQVQSTHSPDFLQLAVNHHCIWVWTNFNLLGERILLTFLWQQERDWLLQVLNWKLLQFWQSILGSILQKHNDACVLSWFA